MAEDREVNAKNCTQESVRKGLKAAAFACIASAVPTFAAVHTIPWAKANINHTGQALIISVASIAAYFVTADKTILKHARKNSQVQYDKYNRTI